MDITDQKTAEIELREENLRLKTSIRNRHGLDKLIGKSMVMREDFYYRINTVCLRMPPLRERKDDILMLAEYFLNKFSDLEVNPELPEKEKSALVGYSWPGNVRELQNVISRFLTINKIELTSKVVSQEGAKKDARVGLADGIEKLEKQAILDALKRNQWHIGNSAADLGISRRTMQRRMIKYDLR